LPASLSRGKQTPQQIVKDSPECKDSVDTFSASYTYLQQIAGLDLAGEWKKIDLPVMVTWGTSDPTTSADENRYLGRDDQQLPFRSRHLR